MTRLTSDVVSNWFGEAFSTLAPELQSLHCDGGTLQGQVHVAVGNGIAGLIGRRIAKSLHIPKPGMNDLSVRISHDHDHLIWDRQFNKTQIMRSRFKPVGSIKNGYWLERTGPIMLMLTVDVRNRGWYWRCLRIKYRRIPMPLWLFPTMEAYKFVEDGDYLFYVGFRLPWIGQLFSYSGKLSLAQR